MGTRATVRPITLDDEPEFLAAARKSRKLHAPWIATPQDAQRIRQIRAELEELLRILRR